MKKIIENTNESKLYFILNDSEYEILLKQNVQEFLNLVCTEKISSFALSSIVPDFLDKKELDLARVRSFLANDSVKLPFYLKISLCRLIESKNYKILFTFVEDGQINQYLCQEATDNECIDIWTHLVKNRDCDDFDWAYENSHWGDNTKLYANYLSIREQQEQKELAHPPLLTDISWSFTGNTYKDKQQFSMEVSKYMANLGKHWYPDKKVLADSELIICYTYFANDTEKTGKITAKSDTDYWTALDLLFVIHNKCVKKLKDEDKHFFEGLSYYEDDNSGKPVYFLDLGS